MNGGHRHRTPLHFSALALYRLADRKHDVISSTPEADGIALLYSNSQGRGGCAPPPLCTLFKTILLFSFLSTPNLKTSCSAQSLHPPSYPITIHPLALSLQSIPTPSVSSTSSVSLPSPPFGYAPHSKTESHVTRELDRYERIIFCHALYNETCITRLHATVAVCHSSCSLHKYSLKKISVRRKRRSRLPDFQQHTMERHVPGSNLITYYSTGDLAYCHKDFLSAPMLLLLLL